MVIHTKYTVVFSATQSICIA